MVCEQCGASFELTPENAGVTSIAFDDANQHVEQVCLCHTCVMAFHALSPDAQQASIMAIRAKQTAQSPNSTE